MNTQIDALRRQGVGGTEATIIAKALDELRRSRITFTSLKTNDGRRVTLDKDGKVKVGKARVQRSPNGGSAPSVGRVRF